MEDLISVRVTIGEESVQYYCAQTSAPQAYDGFGTFTLAEFDSDNRHWRIVMIREDALKWQRGRYASGFFAATRPLNDKETIEEVLWKRFRGEAQ